MHFEFLIGNSGYSEYSLTGKKEKKNDKPFQSKYITLRGYESYDMLGKKGYLLWEWSESKKKQINGYKYSRSND